MNHFKNIKVTGVTEESYKEIDNIINSAKAFARLTYKSVYIIDLFKQEFIFVSDNPLFFSGYSRDEIKSLGFDFLTKSIPEKELDIISNVHCKTIELIHSLPVKERLDVALIDSYSIKNKDSKKIHTFNHQATPLKLSETGDVWLVLCAESIPTNGTKNEIIAYSDKTKRIWKFDKQLKNWEEIEVLNLKKTEQNIIKMSAMGYSIKEISYKLNLSEDTIKFHRKELFKKFGAKNINETINAAYTFRMI